MKLQTLPTTLLFAILTILFLVGTGKCFGQDSIRYENVLFIQKASPKPGQKDSLQRFFAIGNRVRVTDSKHHIAIGKIQKITDSSIIVKDSEFIVKEITRINIYRGTELSIVGASVGSVGAAVLIYSHYDELNSQIHNEENFGTLYYNALGGIIAAVGGVATMFGIIQIASTKYYKIGKQWKLIVISEPVQKINRLKLLNQHTIKK